MDRLIPLDEAAFNRQIMLAMTREPQAVLNMLTEECGELIRAAQKLRRVLDADETMPFTRAKCITDFIEEASDVCLVLDMLADYNLLDRDGMQAIGAYKADRAFWRTFKQSDDPEARLRCRPLRYMAILDELNDGGIGT